MDSIKEWAAAVRAVIPVATVQGHECLGVHPDDMKELRRLQESGAKSGSYWENYGFQANYIDGLPVIENAAAARLPKKAK